MTPLGLDTRDCRDALGRYQRTVATLATVASDPGAPEFVNLDNRFDDLRMQLEVDVRVRESAGGAACMTPLEAAVVAPTLRRMWNRVSDVSGRATAAALMPILGDLARLLQTAMARLPFA